MKPSSFTSSSLSVIHSPSLSLSSVIFSSPPSSFLLIHLLIIQIDTHLLFLLLLFLFFMPCSDFDRENNFFLLPFSLSDSFVLSCESSDSLFDLYFVPRREERDERSKFFILLTLFILLNCFLVMAPFHPEPLWTLCSLSLSLSKRLTKKREMKGKRGK